MASKPKTWSGSPKESHGGCRCRWERADLQVRDAGLAKRSLTQRLSMAFCRFLPSLGNHPDILENGAGENWNLSQSLRFGIWSPGMSTLSWRHLPWAQSNNAIVFLLENGVVWKYRTSEYRAFTISFPMKTRNCQHFWGKPRPLLPLAGSAESWVGGGTRAWTWSGVGWLRGFSILDLHNINII